MIRPELDRFFPLRPLCAQDIRSAGIRDSGFVKSNAREIPLLRISSPESRNSNPPTDIATT